jgi:hypothetical protein
MIPECCSNMAPWGRFATGRQALSTRCRSDSVSGDERA